MIKCFYDLPPLPHYRPCGRFDPDEYGYDDATASDDIAAVQTDFLRAGRWMAIADGVSR